jgi:transcriptional regulator with XRE-family HTH domain
VTRNEPGLLPALLRHFRTRRGLSQLDLELAAEVSARHLSFLETGRAQPSREMVLRLGGTLGLSLRDQNAPLRAAGFEAEFPEPRLFDGMPESVTRAIIRMLEQQEPRLSHHRHRLQRTAERDPRRASHRELLPARRGDGARV